MKGGLGGGVEGMEGGFDDEGSIVVRSFSLSPFQLVYRVYGRRDISPDPKSSFLSERLTSRPVIMLAIEWI